MRAVDIIRKKRDGRALDRAEIEAFVHGAVSGAWPAYQVSALLMAIVLRGMTAEETAALTDCMVHSGVRLNWSDLPGLKVGKHSTGGVGDKTSLVVVPLVAACGVVVPKMSGRGLGHTGGTLDKLESIPGFRVALTQDEFRQALHKIGCALVGQTPDIAPADKALYHLRDVTATVESIPLISSSIMSKKIAEGADALILDVKCGRGAFMKTRKDAQELAESLVAIGQANGVTTRALITAMDQPLGQKVGNSLEIIESLDTLKGRGPADLEQLAVELAAEMLVLARAATDRADARRRVRDTLQTGRGLEKFAQIIQQQGGDAGVVDDYQRLPTAPEQSLYRAERSGHLACVDAEKIGLATMLLGAGRSRAEDTVDHAAGAVLLAKQGTTVRAGDPLLEFHYRDPSLLPDALAMVEDAFAITDEPPEPQPLILNAIP